MPSNLFPQARRRWQTQARSSPRGRLFKDNLCNCRRIFHSDLKKGCARFGRTIGMIHDRLKHGEPRVPSNQRLFCPTGSFLGAGYFYHPRHRASFPVPFLQRPAAESELRAPRTFQNSHRKRLDNRRERPLRKVFSRGYPISRGVACLPGPEKPWMVLRHHDTASPPVITQALA